MARSFVYNRPLDAKILLDPDNPNHEFEFMTSLEIKKEVENDQLEMETEQAPEETLPNSSRLYDDHDPELQSADATNQYDESEGPPHPKLVIKFRDLWRKSEQSVDYPEKKKKSKSRGTKSELLTVRKLGSNKRRRSEFDVASENRITRSSMSRLKSSDSNIETKSTSDCLPEKAASDTEEKQDVWNLGRVTRLKKNLNKECECCGMCFSSDRQLQAHKRYYTANGEYHCTICDISFSLKFQLSRHIKIAHSPVGNDDVYKFKCHLCIDRFERKASLIAHVTHLHNKQVVTHSRNYNKEVLATRPISYVRRKERKKKRARTRKSKKRVRNRVVAIDSNDQETKASPDSQSTQNSNESVKLLLREDEQKDQCSSNQPSNDNVDTTSTQCLTNTNHSERNETSISEKYDEAEAAAPLELQTPINDSSGKLIKLRKARGRNDAVSLNPKLQLLKKNRASPRLLKRNEERSSTQKKSQTDLDSATQTVPSQLGGDLVDHLGNKVGNWCVSDPFDQPRSSALQTTVLTSPAPDTTNIATYSDQQSTSNEELSAPRKSVHFGEDNYVMNRVQHSDGVVEGQKLLPRHQQSEEQVGSVLSDQGSGEFKTASRNIKVEVDSDEEFECDNFGIDLMQVDDFGETYSSNSANYEEEEDSDSSCESISLKMAGSSPSASLADSSSLDSLDGVNMQKSCDTQNNPKFKDLRVCLVKLENILKISNENDFPKSSSLENCSLVKTEPTDGEPMQKEITKDSRISQPSQLRNNSEEVNLSQGSRSMVGRKCRTTVPYRKVLASTKRRGKSRKVGHGIAKRLEMRCFLCDAAFGTAINIAHHYMSVHIEPGVHQCCLCYSNLKNDLKLRRHLPKHYRNDNHRKLKVLCSICRKKRSMPNSTQRCIDCNRNFENQQCDSQKARFPNAQDLPKHRSASETRVSENVSVPLSEISSVSMSNEKKKRSMTVVDHESAKNDENVVSPRTCEENYKNFKCSVCDSVFFESSRLEDHFLTAHPNVEHDKYKSCQNIVKLKPHTLSHPKSRYNKSKPKNLCKNQNSLAKCCVGKKKHAKSENLRGHDKFCKKKSHARQRLRSLQIRNEHGHLVQQHRVRDNTKICFDHKCDVCGLNCCCRKSLKIHKTRYSPNGDKVCNICGLTFAWKHVLVMHMKTAHNPKVSISGRVRCEICNQAFYNKKFLRIHLAHFHNIKYFQCRICRIRFDTCRSLNKHRRYYSRSLSRRCRTCGQSFKCKYMLEYHKAQVHSREKLKTYKYSCDVCSFAFVDELLLQAHIGHFHDIQNREAETNDVSMPTEQLPQNIELQVKTENYYIGSNAFTDISIAREHANEIQPAQGIAEDVVGKTIRTHTSSEYKCGLCKLSFNDPIAILNHEWEFSNEGAYVCTVCNRKFMSNSLMKDHKIKHYQRNVIRKYECYICKEDFSRLNHLKMHGMHLHGPEFAWEKSLEATGVDDRNMSESQTKRDCDGNLKKNSTNNTYGTIGLMASDEGTQSGKILFFKKIPNNNSSTDLLRRHSNEDSYCCCFCQKNFSSELLMEKHVRTHVYRAYYTNTSRYLCLICKDKFRTNDVLRAHVIHCHTSDQIAPDLSKPGCSKDSVPAEPIKSKARGNEGETRIEKDNNKAENVASNLRSKRGIKSTPSNSEKCNGIQRSSRTPPSKKRKLSNSNGEVNIFQSDRAHRTSVPREVEYKTENELECNYLGGGNDRNCSELELVEPSCSGITPHIESDSTPEEVKLFTVIVKDGKGLKKHTCTICIATFSSVAQFRKHFASVHVKNKEYLCTLCGEKFPAMSSLKHHVLKHEEEPRKHSCCNETFLLITDYVRHKISHDEQTEEEENKPNTQSSLSFKAGSPGTSNDELNVTKAGNSCTCEICDKTFPDFKTMLKHWDACIDTNGLQCDLCSASFKSLTLFRMHKTTYHAKKHNSNTVQKRRSFRLNGDRTNQASMQSGIAHDKKLRRRTIGGSAEGNATDKSEKTVDLAKKTSEQNESPKFGKITVKPFAKFLRDFEIDTEHQETDANDTTQSRAELRSSQGTQPSKEAGASKIAQTPISVDIVKKELCSETEGNASTPLSTVLRPAKSITEVPLEDKPASDIVPRKAKKNRSRRRLPVENSNKISKRHSAPTDSGIRKQHKEPEERGPATSQQNSSTTTQNSSSLKSMVHSPNSVEIGNSRMESPEKSFSNDLEVAKPLNLLSTPLNAAESYYLCIQPVADSSGDINNAGIVTSDSGQNLQPNTGSGTLLSSLVSLPLNSGNSPTYFLCVKPTSDNAPKPSTQTVPMSDFKPKSHENIRGPKRLPRILDRSSNVVRNLVHADDIQRITNNGRSTPNVTSNDSMSRSDSNTNEDMTLPAIAGTSSGSGPLASQKNTTMRKNIPMKELVLSKQVVRCSFCNLLFAEKAKLVKHMESHRTDNQCPACGLTFSNERALQQHLPEHKCSTCTKCNMITFFSDAVSWTNGSQKYCSVCNTVLPVPSRKPNRSAQNTSRQLMKCGICMATFDTITQMTVHFKMVHSSYVCGLCEFRFSTYYSLLSHMRSHGIEFGDAIQCKTCRKYFTNLSDLNEHTLVTH